MSRQKEKYIFAVIYHHPCNNSISFFNKLDEKINTLNKKEKKVFFSGHINFNLNPQKLSSLIIDYLQLIESDAPSGLITKPPHKTPYSQTTIDHIFTNVSESMLTTHVLTYVISDHFPIFRNIQNSNFTMTTLANKYIFRNIH